jgi:hypothetical protein
VHESAAAMGCTVSSAGSAVGTTASASVQPPTEGHSAALVVTPRSRGSVHASRRSSAEAAPNRPVQTTSVSLADMRKSRSSDSHVSHSTDTRSTTRLKDYWLDGSNDFQSAREMVQRDYELVEQELQSHTRNRGRRLQPSRSGSHRAFFDIDEGSVQEEPLPETAAAATAPLAHGAASARSALSFEWYNVLQRVVDQPPSTLPPLRLLPGATLAQLMRFPRASEREHITTVSSDNVAEIIAGSIYFVSHRWDSPVAPDTNENAQALLLIDWLDSEHGPTAWHSMYFWIDWSCIEQDDDALKVQQIQSLPIYLRCCTYLVSIAWRDYWKRSWCGLEIVAFDMTKKRIVLTEGGGCEILNNRAEAQARLIRDPGLPHVWDGECSDNNDRQLIMDVMMTVLNFDMQQLDNRERAAAASDPSAHKDNLGDLGALLYTYRRSLQATTVWIGSIPDTVADDLSLRGIFHSAGLICSYISIRLKPGKHKNWALVTFPSAIVAEAAIKSTLRAEDEEGELVTLVVQECQVEQKLLERGSAMSTSGQLQRISANHMSQS